MPSPIRHPVDTATLASAATELSTTGAITFLIDDHELTYTVEGGTIRAQEGRGDGFTAVRLTEQAWADAVGQVRTFISLMLSNELSFERGGFEHLADWEPILKYLHAGSALRSRQGGPGGARSIGHFHPRRRRR